MDDLFEKLKAEPPVDNSKQREEGNLTTTKNNSIEDSSDSPKKRRTSISSISSNSIGGNDDDKVQINDTKLKESIDDDDNDKLKKTKKRTSSELGSDDEITKKSPKKVIPTKASQKLFETSPVDLADDKTKTDNLKNIELKTKPFRVRVKRENLVKLREEFARECAKQKSKRGRNQTPTKKNVKSPSSSPNKKAQTAQKSVNNKQNTSSKKAGNKRKAETNNSPPPTKKGKKDTKGSPTGKKNKSTGFFIKLNNNVKKSPPQQQQHQSPKEKVSTRKISSRGSSTPVYVTKATKFTRSHLIRTFGKRFFNSHVRIERCRHPMMLTYESNARLRKLQVKNKSKNLSVSFKEQVEIIGLSDSESNDSDDNYTPASKSGSTIEAGVMPLHLKKVENGKLVDDIEFDPKLFGDPKADNNSSTPLRKKKTERKSYSPLKDDSSSTARSEILKKANEKLPASALLRLSVDEEDDEDDECEWIVPIDLPERRSSRTNSITQDSKLTTTTTEAPKSDSNDVNKSTTEKPQNNKKVKNTTVTEKPENDETDNNASSVKSSEKDEENTNTSSAEKPQNFDTVKNVSSTEVDKDESIIEKETLTNEGINGSPIHIENNKQINGNGLSVQNENSKEKTEENECASLTDFPRLFDNESSNGTPNPSFTPENQETPDLLVKNALDKLMKDMEKDETEENNTEETSSITEGVNNIGKDESSTISA